MLEELDFVPRSPKEKSSKGSVETEEDSNSISPKCDPSSCGICDIAKICSEMKVRKG